MKNVRTVLAVVAIAVMALLLLRQADPVKGVLPSMGFEAKMSGAQEVPGISTNTTGQLTITFAQDLSSATFQLNVFQGVDVTAAHLHCGFAGAKGPVLVPLFTGQQTVNGTLAQGTFTNVGMANMSAAECGLPMGINNVASLFFAAKEGLIWVNVHTLAHPDGEVRGQLMISQ